MLTKSGCFAACSILTSSLVLAAPSTSIALRAYLKASNPGQSDGFGKSVAIDGNTLVVGARSEGSGDAGVNASQDDNSEPNAGAAYVFFRNGDGGWNQQAYLKASNPETQDSFGVSVAVDGDIVAVGAYWEDSSAKGVNGNQTDNGKGASGAVYIFARDTQGNWSQEAYIKAPNTDTLDQFGYSVGLSGNTLVVGAFGDDSNATGVNGNMDDPSAHYAGAAHVYVRDSLGNWSHQAFLKASNTDDRDEFGWSVAIDGDYIVVGARDEDGNAKGVNGDGDNELATDSGAAYVFRRGRGNTWVQEAYLKASNPDIEDSFGHSVAVSGNLVVIGADKEDSAADKINGSGRDNSAFSSGAAYVFARDQAGVWSQQAYLKAPNMDAGDRFGSAVAVSGRTIAIGAWAEDSGAIGIDGNQADGSQTTSGSAYLFEFDDESASWVFKNYIKASNTWTSSIFGRALALSGKRLLVGAEGEKGGSSGVNGDHHDRSLALSGATFQYDLDAPPPSTIITAFELRGGTCLLHFNSDAALRDWSFRGSSDLRDFSELLPPIEGPIEPFPGQYQATLSLPPETSGKYFLRIER